MHGYRLTAAKVYLLQANRAFLEDLNCQAVSKFNRFSRFAATVTDEMDPFSVPDCPRWANRRSLKKRSLTLELKLTRPCYEKLSAGSRLVSRSLLLNDVTYWSDKRKCTSRNETFYYGNKASSVGKTNIRTLTYHSL